MLEYAARLVIATDRLRFLRRTWWQLLFLALPFLRFLRLVRLLPVPASSSTTPPDHVPSGSTPTGPTQRRTGMGDLAYVSQVRVERQGGPLRAAYLPGEDGPTLYGMHGAIAEHYGAQPGQFPEHASTIDHLVGAALG